MSKSTITEDTVIEVGKSVSLTKYIEFFEKATGKELPSCEFQCWLKTQIGKTIKEAIPTYCMATERKEMKELMSEERFNIISKADKTFIISFDEEIRKLGYDSGGGIGEGYVWAKYMIVYSKTGAKNKKVIARFYIAENKIVLRLFFNDVDKHKTYIENVPDHIKDVFTNNHGNCSCNPQKENCRMRKTYTIDDKQIEKCSGVVFEFWNPTVEKLTDYVKLLAEFYPVKKVKSV